MLSSPKFLNLGHHPITDFTFADFRRYFGQCINMFSSMLELRKDRGKMWKSFARFFRVFSEPNPPVWPQAVHIFAPEAGPLDPLAISLVTGSIWIHDVLCFFLVHDLL